MDFRKGSIAVAGVSVLAWQLAAMSRPASRSVSDTRPAATAAPKAMEAQTTGAVAAEPLTVGFRPDAHGWSGAVRVWPVMPGRRVELPLDWRGARPTDVAYRWVSVERVKADHVALSEKGGPIPLDRNDTAVTPSKPGVYHLELSGAGSVRRLDELAVIVQVPFGRKKGGYLNGYRIGTYPTERQNRRDRYAPPRGFVEVTPQTRALRLSDHFTLGEFLTKDQRSVWPKYVVVDQRLLDKLELVMQELRSMGVRADHMVVMSGFRTPQYNRRGLSQGRARLSRHQYGDAADVWVDNDGDWYMDDLNGDGRRDARDARVVLKAVERVEAKHAELVGGAGIYSATRAHGPFIHIDARGHRARW